jgi:sulfoxide reductase catalytic subunit YedY
MADAFPLWVRVTHFFDFLFLSLLVRSGMEILGAHPKLYWSDDCTPGTEWLGFTKKRPPAGEPWTAEDEIEPLSPAIALPGRNNLGLGRHWHFFSTVGWIACGAIYIALTVATPAWRRIVPTSWAIVPDAWHALLTYATGHLPREGRPFNALQQLVYFLLVFGLAPLQIVTGLLMAPSITAQFPWLLRPFGGRQSARSIHFLGLVAFVVFFVVHVTMVAAHGFGAEMAKIVLGSAERSRSAGTVLGLIGIAAVIGINTWATVVTLRHPSWAKRVLELGIDPLGKLLFHHWTSRQQYGRKSTCARANGRPPRNDAYVASVSNGFAAFRLEIDGLVEHRLSLSLAELRAMPKATHSTLHVCIQGWTYFAEWSGVPIAELIARCAPLRTARYLVFHTMDEKWERPGHGSYYEVIDLETASKPQVLLAYEMNGAPLPVEHGAPLRLRVEHQLGYKMAKWVNRIELVADFRSIGDGQGGWRDDLLHYYRSDAGI